MDKARLGNGAAEEVTRESLIAISYLEPYKILPSNLSSGKLNGETLVKTIDSDQEKFRYELMSISYCSPRKRGFLF
ncbi:unnamed protein product [Prunus armeniaca]|uniref:Uncharacterized protein n=1 Tax=Prunus armeniaca TaxID=36596 RepID=A0A6J5U2E9_PRUAR|nr:unnamed protein product [Prunus armeniaca]